MGVGRVTESMGKQVPESLQAYIQNIDGCFNGNALVQVAYPPWINVEEMIRQSYPTAHRTAYYLGNQPQALDNILDLATQIPDKQVDVYIPFELSTFFTYQNVSYLLSFLLENQAENVRFIFIQTLNAYSLPVEVNTQRFDQFLLKHFAYRVTEKEIFLLH